MGRGCTSPSLFADISISILEVMILVVTIETMNHKALQELVERLETKFNEHAEQCKDLGNTAQAYVWTAAINESYRTLNDILEEIMKSSKE